MNAILTLITVVSLTTAVPSPGRRYEPSEENADRISSFLWEDDNGNFHYENLTRNEDDVRATASDVTLYLYTINNPLSPVEIQCNDFATMIAAEYYSPSKQNVFVTHGWNNNYESPVNKLLVSALLSKHDVNIFVVDWGKIADKIYPTAMGSVKDLGDAVGDFINNMISHFDLTVSKFNLIGHSLGAHISGCAGARVNGKVNYIMGLDPAGPLFTLGNTENRLDPSDAEFVQVIHTSGLILGFLSAIGHVDYYPNGGNRQPGCGIDAAGTCAHSRAYLYFAESIKFSGFTSHKCSSHSDYVNGKCKSNAKSYMGSYAADLSASGDHYLVTNEEEPFSID